ncbi:hypothetical protein BGW36DRAFT_204430 [Talaromyces proteolyticus]|uniref:CFEM domain-containing protein n=1 Tax=Talaromyces proteolyticus TaxID=1131652 RepID=A0AAD4PZA4_9EURO|nr:uncharacterized protein BGW36DRAFT_204430 [Talaromyces proteolyticus]KAH8695562.1 hypothetical protein BGW36DRAFT_204430 [Talaromyces proteolyticus]
MLLALGEWRSSVLLIASITIGLAQASSASCDSSDKGQWLTQVIPTCALPCVEHFIQSEFDSGSCCDGTSLTCLCQTNSTSGLTLGEAAFACTIGSCAGDIASNTAGAAYGICNDVYGALPETHATITATRFISATQIPSSSATSEPLSTTVPTARPSATESLSPTTTLSTQVSSTHVIPTITTFAASTIPSLTTSIASSSTPAYSPAVQSSAKLSSPAVIGISVASGISTIFLISVAVLLCGRKLRRRKMESKENFEIGGYMSEPPEFNTGVSSNPINPAPTPGGAVNIGPNFHQFPLQPVIGNGPLQVVTHMQDKEITAHVFTPETNHSDSPESQTSQHTFSLLLPEKKATYGLFPEPLKLIRVRQPPIPRPSSEATIIEEDEDRPKSIFGPLLDRSRMPSRAGLEDRQNGQLARRPVGLPSNPRARMRPKNRNRDQNSLHLGSQIYKWETPDDVGLPPTPPPKSDGSVAVGRAVTRYSLGPGPSPGHFSTGSTRLQRNFSRLGNGHRPMNRTMGTSETPATSPDAPEADYNEAGHSPAMPAQLTPVQETNTNEDIQRVKRSPVKYPTALRSASVAPVAVVVPSPRVAKLYSSQTSTTKQDEQDSTDACSRSPSTLGLFNIPLFLDTSSRSRSSSPGKLLAKRRGEKMAERMENAFRIGVQNDQGTSVNQNRGRPRWKVVRNDSLSGTVSVARSNTPKTPRTEEIKPSQKHNITPTRRGEDLYLSVD